MLSLTINGTSYSYPQTGDVTWGDGSANWASAVTSGMLQKAGGTFTLTADVNFGPNFGLLSAYFSSRGTVASSGVVRLAKTESISWRNNAGSGNNTLATDASDNLQYNGVTLGGNIPVSSGGTGITSYTAGDTIYASGSTTLAKLAIGSANKVLTSTGSAPAWNTLVNANIDAAAAIAYSKLSLTGSIVNADLSASAAIARSKVATGTASHVLINDGSGNLSSEATLAKSRGGAGADMSSVTFPSSGTLATTFSSSQIVCDTPNGHGSTGTKIRKWTNQTTTGTDITYTASASNSNNGDLFTINTAGLYQVSYVDFCAGSNASFGISLNSNQLATSIGSITTANRLQQVGVAAGFSACVSVVVRCAATDQIRAHTDGSPDAASAVAQFRIVRIL